MDPRTGKTHTKSPATRKTPVRGALSRHQSALSVRHGGFSRDGVGPQSPASHQHRFSRSRFRSKRSLSRFQRCPFASGDGTQAQVPASICSGRARARARPGRPRDRHGRYKSATVATRHRRVQRCARQRRAIGREVTCDSYGHAQSASHATLPGSSYPFRSCEGRLVEVGSWVRSCAGMVCEAHGSRRWGAWSCCRGVRRRTPSPAIFRLRYLGTRATRGPSGALRRATRATKCAAPTGEAGSKRRARRGRHATQPPGLVRA
jgi:hypothetical protein